jgi:hypothetical protein
MQLQQEMEMGAQAAVVGSSSSRQQGLLGSPLPNATRAVAHLLDNLPQVVPMGCLLVVRLQAAVGQEVVG